MTGAGRIAATLLLLSGVSAVFSWPLAIRPLDLVVTRQFDVYGLLWLLHAAPDIGAGLSTGLSMWPFGEALFTLDSFLAFLAGRAGLDPVAVVSFLVLAGPVLSGWAAERYARAIGAAWPWSLVAGLGYGFCGCAATALLEGHVYDLLNPWLPLLAGAWSRAIGPEGRVRDGLLAGLWWTLALLTSAYLGLCATAIVLVLGGASVLRSRPRAGPLAAAAAVALPSGLAYAAVLAGGSEARTLLPSGQASVLEMLRAGSARLPTLAGWFPTVDHQWHSASAALGFTALVLALAAPWVLARRDPWGRHLVLAGLGLAIALGPFLELSSTQRDVPWLLHPFLSGEAGRWFRFPIRFLWITALGLGAVGALVATRLAASRPRLALPLIAAAVVDATLGQGTVLRLHRVPDVVPSAYRAIGDEGAVLEVFPEFYGSEKDLPVYLNTLTCTFQRTHRRPVLNFCLSPFPPTGPHMEAGRWIQERILAGDTATLGGRLGAVGVGWVVLRPDLFPRGTREELVAGLEAALGAPVADTRDGGEHVSLWAVADPEADPARARAAWTRALEGS